MRGPGGGLEGGEGEGAFEGCVMGVMLADAYEIRRVMRQVCQGYPTSTRNGNRNRLEHVSSVKGSKLHTSPPKQN